MSLELLKNTLNKKKSQFSGDYHIPRLWLEPELAASKEIIKVNPYEFILNRINEIDRIAAERHFMFPRSKENWTNSANIYNLFVRLFSAFDHNQNGKIDLEAERRETGTFAKAIALLPYIHSLGVNTIYLLPITSIGVDQKKGSLGSPYAIKNPYKIEESLSEPYLELGAEAEFLAFMQAAKKLGIKICLEFVFRTASVDSDLALERPDWFYWIKNEIPNRARGSENPHHYGPPIFAERTLDNIKCKIGENSLKSLPSPLQNYKKMFDSPDGKVKVEKGKVIAKNKKGEKIKIASAFADWPPDDNQPVWSDVTYLKLYTPKKFDYIAYNTVRMYDSELAQEKYINQDLWNYIENIGTHYIQKFDIDGIMIDMGHALPNELRAAILDKSRKIKRDFAFWEENFSINIESKENGYDAVLGYLPFDAYDINKVKGLVWRLSHEDLPIHFFSTSETHNVRRTASIKEGIELSKVVYLLTAFIPAIPFIHSGFELCETKPVNTGLCFSDEEIAMYPPEKLALFSESSLEWTHEQNIVDFIRKAQTIRCLELPLELTDDISIDFVEMFNNNLVGFKRKSIRGEYDLMIILNYSEYNESFYYEEDNLCGAIDLIEETEYNIDWNKIKIDLPPYTGKVIRLKTC